MRQTQEFEIPQEVLLSETSFGQQYWSGPGIVVKVEARKIRVRFGNKENDYFPDTDSNTLRILLNKGRGTC